MSSTFSVRDVGERYAVSAHTVLQWIGSGELRAINVGRRTRSKKPRWRITAEALAAFEQLRTPTPPPPRGRRKQRAEDIIQFYD